MQQVKDAVLWNGNQLSRVPDFISKALNNFNYKEPGYVSRTNNTIYGAVIFVGTTQGEKFARTGDYIVQYDDESLDVMTEMEYKQATDVKEE